MSNETISEAFDGGEKKSSKLRERDERARASAVSLKQGESRVATYALKFGDAGFSLW